jgi:hypothetical protein
MRSTSVFFIRQLPWDPGKPFLKMTYDSRRYSTMKSPILTTETPRYATQRRVNACSRISQRLQIRVRKYFRFYPVTYEQSRGRKSRVNICLKKPPHTKPADAHVANQNVL